MRLSDSLPRRRTARFVDALRPQVQAARESLAAQRAQLGALVRVEDARLFTAARIAGHCCPAGLVPIGDTVMCGLMAGGRRRELKVRRSANSHIEVEVLP